jgi:hypothetical protein
MKIVVLICLLFAGLLYSANNLGHMDAVTITPAIAFDDVFCSQVFVYANLANGLGFSAPDGWMVADDFTYAQDGYINYIQIWALYTSGNPTGFNIQLRADAPGPGSVVSSHSSTSCMHYNTGYYSSGYPLYQTDITVDNIAFIAGTKYWIAIQSTGGGGSHYWLATNQTWADMTYFSPDNGTTWISSEVEWGTPYEQFMVISGEVTALSRGSWGAIKALF